jgi:single-strand DNA-binding protein
MSWDINRVIIVGRLTNDVELKYIPSGSAVARFGIAVGGRPRQDGADSVSFFTVVVWGKAAETCSNYLAKGKQVALDGRLEQRSWTAQDGSRRSVVEVVAERVEFLGSAGANKQGSAPQQNAGSKPAPVNFEDNFYDNTDFNSAPVDPGTFQDDQNPGDPNF